MALNSELVEEHTHENAAIFKKVAWFYDLTELALRKVHRVIAKELKDSPYILDVACGTGTQALQLASDGHTVVGIDISKEMLEKANRKRGNEQVTFQEMDATKIEYSDDTFDATIISLALHDMPPEIAKATMQEMKRVTKKDGKILVLDYAVKDKRFASKVFHYFAPAWESRHYHDYIAKGLRAFMPAEDLKKARRTRHAFGVLELYIFAAKDF